MKLLVLCTGNSCRSQIAEGYLKKLVSEHKLNVEIVSAGVETHGLNPRAVNTMAEDGVDISDQKSELVDTYLGSGVTHLFTVCDHAVESCPVFPEDVIRIHHSFPDPAKASGTEEEIMKSFAATRDLIKEYTSNLIKQYFLN